MILKVTLHSKIVCVCVCVVFIPSQAPTPHVALPDLQGRGPWGNDGDALIWAQISIRADAMLPTPSPRPPGRRPPPGKDEVLLLLEGK